MKSIVIIPTYNEKENIKKIISKILDLGLGINVLIVDDNSPDGTGRIVDGLAQKFKNKIFVLHRQEKNGLGKAYIAGFKWALAKKYDVIMQMDADFSHDPEYLKIFLKDIIENDLVIGSRYVKNGGTKGWGVGRKMISRGGSLYSKIILGVPMNDLTGGFKCWRADLLEKIELDSVISNGYSFQIEMNYRAATLRRKIKEVPIIFVDRTVGKSKMNKKIILEALWKVWMLRLGNKSWLKK